MQITNFPVWFLHPLLCLESSEMAHQVFKSDAKCDKKILFVVCLKLEPYVYSLCQEIHSKSTGCYLKQLMEYHQLWCHSQWQVSAIPFFTKS